MRQAGSSGYCGVWLVFVIPECPSPHETHPRRKSNEESPGRPQCGFHLTRPDSRACINRSVCMATRPARAAAVRPPLIGLGRVFVIPECPSPRKAHPHHDPNEESPESQWLFGAGLGARSPQRTPRGKRRKADMVTQKRSSAAPPTPFSVPSVLRVPPSLSFSVGIAIKKRTSPK